MSQVNVVAGTAATYCKVESTYGTTPGSMTRIFPRGTVEAKTEQTTIAVDTQQVNLLLRDLSAHGYKRCTAKLQCDSYIDSTQLNSAASPTTTWLGAMIKTALGGESMAAGSTYAAGSTASIINTAVGHGSRFPVGQVAICDVGNVPEIAVVTAVSTDAVSVWPSLSASPTTGQDIFNSHTYYFTDANTATMALQLALAQDSSTQWTLNGLCISGLAIDLSRDQRLSYTFDFKGSSFTGPSSQSIATTVGTNSLAGPMVNTSAVCLLQPIATTTRVHVPMESISLAISTGNDLIEQVGGSNEGTTGAFRGAPPTVEATVAVAQDSAFFTDYDSNTLYAFVYAVPRGTGATKRWSGFILYCTVEMRPEQVPISQGRMGVSLKLRQIDNRLQSTVTTDLARSPFVIFEG